MAEKKKTETAGVEGWARKTSTKPARPNLVMLPEEKVALDPTEARLILALRRLDKYKKAAAEAEKTHAEIVKKHTDKIKEASDYVAQVQRLGDHLQAATDKVGKLRRTLADKRRVTKPQLTELAGAVGSLQAVAEALADNAPDLRMNHSGEMTIHIGPGVGQLDLAEQMSKEPGVKTTHTAVVDLSQ